MAERAPTGNTLVDKAEQLKQKIEEATDLNKLVKDKKFLTDLKKLPQMEQFKIFEQYKDQFVEISKDPKSTIAKWTGGLTKNLPNIGNAQQTLNNSIQQGQHVLQDFTNTLGQFSRSSPK